MQNKLLFDQVSQDSSLTTVVKTFQADRAPRVPGNRDEFRSRDQFAVFAQAPQAIRGVCDNLCL